MRARCLIVDDEAPARDELRHLLGHFEDVEVVGEATTAEEARVLIDAVAYDVVLLDVRMPGTGGLALARQLWEAGRAAEHEGRARPPAVIFTTAYADHAVEAFDLAATDYLVKPFDGQRLRRALDRALAGRDGSATTAAATDTSRDGPSSPPTAVPGPSRPLGVRLPVHRGDRIILIDEHRVAFAEASGGYAELKLVARPGAPTPLADDRLLTSYTLADLEERFSDAFVRTHRSYLVNLRHVREVVPQVGGTLYLVMADRDGAAVPVARRQATAIRARLGV